jgi:hypothetical protein
MKENKMLKKKKMIKISNKTRYIIIMKKKINLLKIRKEIIMEILKKM